MEATSESNKDSEIRINQELNDAITSGKSVTATLMTDERVFARITDGIYRDPASAIRELIANSYDADATEVRVETDCPRFSKISVRDNGKGLTKETLAHVICHIGGSLKRTKDGQNHQISSESDPTKSPSGRPLIGKLGIGLFSVSQITHHVVIITKTKGSKKRIYCDILLMPQSEALLEKEEGQKFVTGEVTIKFIDAEDSESQGTEIILHDLRDHVKESLLSKLTWTSLREKKEREENPEEDTLESVLDDDDYDGSFSVKEPIYHIGEIDIESGTVLTVENLPWLHNDAPDKKFNKLIDRVSQISDPERAKKGPSIQEHLDYYLRMLWALSLSLPIPYIEKHPFVLTSKDTVSIYQISNKLKGGSASEVIIENNQTIAEKFSFKTAAEHHLPFKVYVDDILLYRPIKFGVTSKPDQPASKPLMLVGRAKPDLSSVPAKYRGGDLEFEAYLYWNQKIVPKEHNGVLIRINGASGTLFKDNFLEYQISELTRLRQITAEIFVIKGLDAALNIDRESFNISHPHYLILKNWLHSAMRQLMNRLKTLSGDANKEKLEEKKEETFAELSQILSRHAAHTGKTTTKEVIYTSKKTEPDLLTKIKSTTHLEISDHILASIAKERPTTPRERFKKTLNEEKAKSLASILSLYGIDEYLSEGDFESLISAILEVMILEIKK